MRRVMLFVVLLVAACTAEAEPATSTSTSTAMLSTSTTVPTTTIATFGGPEEEDVELLTHLTRLEPGVRYLHQAQPGQIVAPFTIQVQLPNWRVDEIGRGFVQFRNDTTDPGTRAAVVVFSPNDSPAALIAEITGPDRAADFTEPQPISLGSLDGMTVDVLVLDDEDNRGTPPNLLPGDPACMTKGLLLEEGNTDGTAWYQILAGCAWNRVWVFDVEDLSMTLTVSPDVLSRETINELDELGPHVDDFINAITFCTRADPCDE